MLVLVCFEIKLLGFTGSLLVVLVMIFTVSFVCVWWFRFGYGRLHVGCCDLDEFGVGIRRDLDKFVKLVDSGLGWFGF